MPSTPFYHLRRHYDRTSKSLNLFATSLTPVSHASLTPVRSSNNAALLDNVAQFSRQTKIPNHNFAGLVYHQVGRLDIPMNHTIAVDERESS
jgi:hypothetical protein